MADLIDHQVRHAGGLPDRAADPEAVARRALGLDAVWCASLGAAALLGARPVARHVDLPAPVVRLAGAGAVGWAGAVGLWAVGEGWVPATRRVVVANGVATAALTGHAAARGTRGGRVGVLLVAAQAAGFAVAQARALVAAQPGRGAAAEA